MPLPPPAGRGREAALPGEHAGPLGRVSCRLPSSGASSPPAAPWRRARAPPTPPLPPEPAFRGETAAKGTSQPAAGPGGGKELARRKGMAARGREGRKGSPPPPPVARPRLPLPSGRAGERERVGTAMARTLVELFYDVVSPYSWLAFEVRGARRGRTGGRGGHSRGGLPFSGGALRGRSPPPRAEGPGRPVPPAVRCPSGGG